MANYYMYTCNLSKIKEGEVKPISLRIDGKLSHKFKLEELDCLTSLYPSEDALLTELAKSSQYQSMINSKSKITIVHKANKKLVSDDVIYDDKFLFRCAKEVRDRKKKGEKATDIYLTATKDVRDFVSKIKNYLLDAETNELILSDKSIGSNPHLRELINNYVSMIKEPNLEITQIKWLQESEDKLNASLRKYSIMRKFIVWEKKYKNTEIKTDTTFVQREIDVEGLSKPIEESNMILNNKRIVPRKKYSLDELLDDNLLYYWYNQGGSAAVLQNMDLDDILQYSKTDLDAVGLGYLKNNSKEEDNEKLR